LEKGSNFGFNGNLMACEA